MNEETEEIREPRSLRGRHPLFFFGMLWVLGGFLAASGTFFYYAISSTLESIVHFFPASKPSFVALFAVGVIFGAGVLLFIKRRYRRKGDEVALEWVFPHERTFWENLRLCAWIGIPAIVYVIIGEFYLEPLSRKFGLASQLGSMLGFYFGSGVAVFLQLFLYPDYVRVYKRAKEIAAQYRGPEETPKKARRPLPWPGIISIFSICVVLALAAWLQWILPQASTAEPEPFETEMIIGSGPATRLTYGMDAYSPSISPDGKRIAYLRESFFPNSPLEIMNADGRNKRCFNKKTDPSPFSFSYLNWSPDSSKILLVGADWQRDFRPFEDSNDLDYSNVKFYLWTVDINSGSSRKFFTKDEPFEGFWLQSGRGIAFVAGKRETAHLWLMDINGREQRVVKGVTLTGHYPSVQPWHGGREVVVACSKETPGIWSVDVPSAKATRLADMPTYWAIPYDETRLVIGARGKAYPPRKSATSIGLFDTKTGEIKWALKDIQGSIHYPHLLQKSAKLVCVFSNRESKDVWTISLKDGTYKDVISIGGFGQIAVDPDESSVVFAASNNDLEITRKSESSTGIWRFAPGRSW